MKTKDAIVETMVMIGITGMLLGSLDYDTLSTLNLVTNIPNFIKLFCFCWCLQKTNTVNFRNLGDIMSKVLDTNITEGAQLVKDYVVQIKDRFQKTKELTMEEPVLEQLVEEPATVMIVDDTLTDHLRNNHVEEGPDLTVSSITEPVIEPEQKTLAAKVVDDSDTITINLEGKSNRKSRRNHNSVN